MINLIILFHFYLNKCTSFVLLISFLLLIILIFLKLMHKLNDNKKGQKDAQELISKILKTVASISAES